MKKALLEDLAIQLIKVARKEVGYKYVLWGQGFCKQHTDYLFSRIINKV